jgi:hypothetical protein
MPIIATITVMGILSLFMGWANLSDPRTTTQASDCCTLGVVLLLAAMAGYIFMVRL